MGSRCDVGARYGNAEAARSAARDWNSKHGVGSMVRYAVGQTAHEARTERPAIAHTWQGRPVVLVYVPEAGEVGGVRALHLSECEVVQATAGASVPVAAPAPLIGSRTIEHLEARQQAAQAERKAKPVRPLPDPWVETHFAIEVSDGLLRARVLDPLRECNCERGFRFGIDGAVIDCWRCKAIGIREGAFDALRLRAGGKRAGWTFAALNPRLVMPLGSLPEVAKGRPSTPMAWLRQWAEAWTPGAPGPMLAGHTGRGKSHIAAALQRHFALVRGVQSVWVHWPMFLARLKATFGDDAPETKHEIVAPLLSSPLVVIDDLRGSETSRGMSSWAQDETALLLERLADAGTTLIVTTNVAGPAELAEGVGGAAASRLAEMTLPVGIGGEDYRAGGGR